ncbi:hypothetical protein SKAU_G00025050 [Synaphobranchus kaupii]|uniref:Uncharacterized protein n=1 Tax=Synaphobranchus kaupii TaxID=118154 RepID=A0A9Q1GD44_SYNKA|nr:hypothetical protein SKAU_G00025050 [Synaphobranchus kaupii]
MTEMESHEKRRCRLAGGVTARERWSHCQRLRESQSGIEGEPKQHRRRVQAWQDSLWLNRAAYPRASAYEITWPSKLGATSSAPNATDRLVFFTRRRLSGDDYTAGFVRREGNLLPLTAKSLQPEGLRNAASPISAEIVLSRASACDHEEPRPITEPAGFPTAVT